MISSFRDLPTGVQYGKIMYIDIFFALYEHQRWMTIQSMPPDNCILNI